MKKCIFIFIMTMVMGSVAHGLSDDFEDGVIDTSMWAVGGEKRSYLKVPAGSWDYSHEEITGADGYLRTRVWGPTSGNTYGHDAWVRTKQDFNDGKSYLINFTWEAEVVGAGWVDFYFIQITDGYTPTNESYNWPIVNPPVGTTDLLWHDSGGNPVNCWTLLNGMAKTSMSIKITPDGTAKLYDGPNGSGNLLHQGSLNPNVEWYIRFMVSDATSAGHPGGDSRINLYDFSVVSEPTYEWHTYNGHQYAVTKDYCNWADAEAEAVALGGHLVTINDAAENAWLTATFGGYDDAGHHGVWAHLLWIGFEHKGGDMTDPSNWQWVSGQPVTYIGTWYDGSPVGPPAGGGPHAYLHPSTHPIQGTWFNAAARDTDPVSYPHGIIEIGEPPCPPPPTVPPWSFVHITDTHIGDTQEATDSLCAARHYIKNHMSPMPAFVLVTGDISHVGCKVLSSGCPLANYLEFTNIMKSFEIPYYTIPGNHDRTKKIGLLCQNGLDCYESKIEIPQDTTPLPLSGTGNYWFEKNGYLFIGLDTGGKHDAADDNLTNEQMGELLWLGNNNKCMPKIVFMHHPAAGGGGLMIVKNRDDFLDWCDKNDVKVVITGHTHQNIECDRNGDPWDAGEVGYIQTPSETKWPGGGAGRSFRILNVNGGIVSIDKLIYTEEILGGRLEICKHSPVELHVYDSQGRHVEIDPSGIVEGEIPGSYSFPKRSLETEDGSESYPDKIIIFDPNDDYLYELIGTEGGTYGLNITLVSEGEETTFEAAEIPTSPGARHVYAVDWGTLSAGEEGVILKIDKNGDGFFEQMAIADNELSYDEFALQTETVVDFDPDTLNLKSKGKFATVYIELPEDFDVSEIDLFSLTLLTLNELVPPLQKPVEIGDYDNDGINDLMVKFDLQELIEVLEPGEQIIDLTGRLWDGRRIAGFDFIRVIH